jgi:hypothetical protein
MPWSRSGLAGRWPRRWKQEDAPGRSGVAAIPLEDVTWADSFTDAWKAENAKHDWWAPRQGRPAPIGGGRPPPIRWSCPGLRDQDMANWARTSPNPGVFVGTNARERLTKSAPGHGRKRRLLMRLGPAATAAAATGIELAGHLPRRQRRSGLPGSRRAGRALLLAAPSGSPAPSAARGGRWRGRSAGGS